MHWSGKVFAWLLIPLVLTATVLSAKLVKVRNSWTAKVEKTKKEYLAVAPKVEEAKLAYTRVIGDWQRATQMGAFDIAQTTIQNANAGTLTVAIGSTKGVAQGKSLHGFEIRPDGSAIYRGEFTAVTVREGESSLQPNWRLRPGDTDGWQPGNWRWRLVIPSAYPNLFADMQQRLLQQDELFADRTQTLDIHEKLIMDAKAQLKLREAELVGGPELQQDAALDPEFRQGLVATLEALEEERNSELIAIDRLRRSVRQLNRSIQDTQAANRELVNKLPRPAAEVSRKPSPD